MKIRYFITINILLFTAITSREVINLQQISLIKEDGSNTTLEQYKNKIVVLNFWATWCHPCLREIPELNKLYNKFRDQPGIAFLAISVKGKPEKVAAYQETNPISFEVLLDYKEELADYYNVSQMPTTILLSPSGKTVFRQSGFSPKAIENLEKEIEKLL